MTTHKFGDFTTHPPYSVTLNCQLFKSQNCKPPSLPWSHLWTAPQPSESLDHFWNLSQSLEGCIIYKNKITCTVNLKQSSLIQLIFICCRLTMPKQVVFEPTTNWELVKSKLADTHLTVKSGGHFKKPFWL